MCRIVNSMENPGSGSYRIQIRQQPDPAPDVAGSRSGCYRIQILMLSDPDPAKSNPDTDKPDPDPVAAGSAGYGKSHILNYKTGSGNIRILTQFLAG